MNTVSHIHNMGQEGPRTGQQTDLQNVTRKRKIEDEAGVQSKKACLENEIFLEYLDGENSGIAVLSINRPSTRNALSWKLVEDLQAAVDEVGEEKTVRCLILTSQVQNVFCAGADLKERTQMSEERVLSYLKKLNKLVATLEELSIPVIAAVEGAALGGGLEMILGCDMRVGTTSSTFGLPETRLGVIPGGGGTVRLGRLVGWGRARHIILTGGRVGGRQAEQWGLLNICVDDGAAYNKALEMAREVARGAPLAVRMAKIALRSAETLEKGKALETERVCYEKILPSWDRREGLRAWAERRNPVFRGE
jgi:methylglutaconyl-CoA hydratase